MLFTVFLYGMYGLTTAMGGWNVGDWCYWATLILMLVVDRTSEFRHDY